MSFSFRVWGVLSLVISPLGWWLDRDFERHGVQVTPTVTALRRVDRPPESESGPTDEYFIDLQYTDRHGQVHHHTVRSDGSLPASIRWPLAPLAVGDALPLVEYLDYAPQRYRFASLAAVPWWAVPLSGIVYLVVAAALVLGSRSGLGEKRVG